MSKFKGGDVVKLINDVGLYTSENLRGHERLELDKAYAVYSVENNGEFIRLIKDSGETEGVFSYRLIHAEPETTAESLRKSILDTRSKREALQQEILRLGEQEKEALEKLKELDFLLANDPFEEGSSFCVEVGDIVRCVSVEDPGYSIGNLNTSLDVLYTVEHVFGEVDGKQKVSIEERVGGIGLVGVNYEFHSRPVK